MLLSFVTSWLNFYIFFMSQMKLLGVGFTQRFSCVWLNQKLMLFVSACLYSGCHWMHIVVYPEVKSEFQTKVPSSQSNWLWKIKNFSFRSVHLVFSVKSPGFNLDTRIYWKKEAWRCLFQNKSKLLGWMFMGLWLGSGWQWLCNDNVRVCN